MKKKNNNLFCSFYILVLLVSLTYGCKKDENNQPSIGSSKEGGKVFYIDATGQHGLIAAPSDQSAQAEWGCDGYIIGGTSTSFGTGQANTLSIVNGCNEGLRAAKICYDLELNGYSDWFLPSKDELNKLYLQKALIGGFANDLYWCSSEGSKDWSWCQNFSSGEQESNLYKSNKINVRAIRSF